MLTTSHNSLIKTSSLQNPLNQALSRKIKSEKTSRQRRTRLQSSQLQEDSAQSLNKWGDLCHLPAARVWIPSNPVSKWIFSELKLKMSGRNLRPWTTSWAKNLPAWLPNKSWKGWNLALAKCSTKTSTSVTLFYPTMGIKIGLARMNSSSFLRTSTPSYGESQTKSARLKSKPISAGYLRDSCIELHRLRLFAALNQHSVFQARVISYRSLNLMWELLLPSWWSSSLLTGRLQKMKPSNLCIP